MTKNKIGAEVYLLHGWIRQISPMMWRRLLVRNDFSIAGNEYRCHIRSPDRKVDTFLIGNRHSMRSKLFIQPKVIPLLKQINVMICERNDIVMILLFGIFPLHIRWLAESVFLSSHRKCISFLDLSFLPKKSVFIAQPFPRAIEQGYREGVQQRSYHQNTLTVLPDGAMFFSCKNIAIVIECIVLRQAETGLPPHRARHFRVRGIVIGQEGCKKTGRNSNETLSGQATTEHAEMLFSFARDRQRLIDAFRKDGGVFFPKL